MQTSLKSFVGFRPFVAPKQQGAKKAQRPGHAFTCKAAVVAEPVQLDVKKLDGSVAGSESLSLKASGGALSGHHAAGSKQAETFLWRQAVGSGLLALAAGLGQQGCA